MLFGFFITEMYRYLHVMSCTCLFLHNKDFLKLSGLDTTKSVCVCVCVRARVRVRACVSVEVTHLKKVFDFNQSDSIHFGQITARRATIAFGNAMVHQCVQQHYSPK